MERKRILSIAALCAGLLALAWQAAMAAKGVHMLVTFWHETRPKLYAFSESMNRFSQLKPSAFKYPASAVYFVLAALAVVGFLGWLVVTGVRQAVTGDVSDDDESLR